MNQHVGPGNVADRDQVRKSGKKERQRLAVEREEMKTLLRLPGFRRFVWRYLEAANVFRTTFDGSTEWTLFREGKRNIGLKLMDEIMGADVQAFVEMQKEFNQMKETDDAADPGRTEGAGREGSRGDEESRGDEGIGGE